MKIKIYLEKEDVEEYLEDLADNFSEDNFENALADFYAHPEQIDYDYLIMRSSQSIICRSWDYIRPECFEIEKL